MVHRICSGLLILAAALGLSGCASVGPTALDDTRLQYNEVVKRTAELIPLCHPLRITGVDVHFEPRKDAIDIVAEVRAFDRTGVEMEALTAVTVAALTIYDMCKAVDRDMRIVDVKLEEKSGGRSGHYQRDAK